MKKNIFLTTIIAALMFSSCDYMKNFDNLDELSKSTEVSNYEYTITDADFKTIADALNKNKVASDSAMAKSLTDNKVFSVNAPALVAIPYLLKSKYIGANKNSAAKITYNYKTGTMGYYTLTPSDYSGVWGAENIKTLSPAKSPATVLPGILAAKYPKAIEGDIKVLEYQYSATEPSSSQNAVAFSENFEGYTAGTGVLVPTTTSFVINKDVKGAIAWQCRTFSSNKYAQVTSNGSGVDNEAWLITNKIDLSSTYDASFKFDVTAGYYNADCLTVLVSENFNGTQAGIATATWKDVTSNFTLPKAPATGYGVLGTAGTMSFTAYAGKKVYIAFKYTGTGIAPLKTTTFQIDNISVTSAAPTQTQFAYYQYTGGAWTLVSKSYYLLAASDYTDMGVTTLSATTAPNYIPALLKSKFPYAQEGSTKVVAYKGSSANTADEYVLKSGVWTPLSLVETRTDQFVFSGWDVSGWVFDPTIYVTMKKGLNATDDYMLVTNYVKDHQAINTPSLLGYYKAALEYEYYYGFDAYNGSISWKEESTRLNDPDYAKLTTIADKVAYMTQRTQEGLAIYLGLKYPDAQPKSNDVDQYCYVTTIIYGEFTSDNYNTITTAAFSKTTYKYKYQRIDNGNLKWKYISREKL
jgi:hypothetical protein